MHEWHEFKYYINVDIDIEGFNIDFIILTLEVYLFDLPKLFTLLMLLFEQMFYATVYLFFIKVT